MVTFYGCCCAQLVRQCNIMLWICFCFVAHIWFIQTTCSNIISFASFQSCCRKRCILVHVLWQQNTDIHGNHSVPVFLNKCNWFSIPSCNDVCYHLSSVRPNPAAWIHSHFLQGGLFSSYGYYSGLQTFHVDQQLLHYSSVCSFLCI